MKSKKIVSLLLTGAMAAALLAAPAQAAPPAVRIGSYKGNTLTAGEINGLMIYPNTAGDSVVSSDPDVVCVGNVLGHWTATAKGSGMATITATAPDGQTGSVTITVVSAESTPSIGSDESESTSAYSEVRQELIRLINQGWPIFAGRSGGLVDSDFTPSEKGCFCILPPINPYAND